MDAVMKYSPFAFSSALLEERYLQYQSISMGSNFPLMILMVILFWTTALLRSTLSSIPADRLASIFAGGTLCAAVGLLSVRLRYRTLYQCSWPLYNFAIHLAHIPVFTAARTILIMLYDPGAAGLCATRAQCAHQLLLLVPHFATGSMAALGIPLPLLLQITMQVTVLMASYRGHFWICSAPHPLAPLVLQHVLGLGAPSPLPLPPAVPTGGLEYPESPMEFMLGKCQANLAFWDMQAAMLAIVMSLLADIFGRWRFLARQVVGDGAVPSPQWEALLLYKAQHWVALGLTVVVCDALIISIVSLPAP
eukprot:jgi/Botrbrau1/5618/Bobra.55_1s0007.1